MNNSFKSDSVSSAHIFAGSGVQQAPEARDACTPQANASVAVDAADVATTSSINRSPPPIEAASGLPHPESEIIEFLDPHLVRIGNVPNRSPESFTNEAFEDLRYSIGANKGNSQPILVRRLPEVDSGDLHQPRYELVYGERRLTACRLEQVKVKAIVCEMTGSSVLDTLIENSNRADLSAYELGCQINHALSTIQGLSQRILARNMGTNVSIISRASAIARLPQAVIESFGSPADIRYSDAKPLGDAISQCSTAVLDEARRIVAEGVSMDGRQVVKRLIGVAKGGVAQVNTPVATRLSLDGEEFGEAVFDALGRSTISLQIKLTESQQAALIKQIELFVSRKVKRKKSTDLPTKDPANISHARPKGSVGKSNEVVS